VAGFWKLVGETTQSRDSQSPSRPSARRAGRNNNSDSCSADRSSSFSTTGYARGCPQSSSIAMSWKTMGLDRYGSSGEAGPIPIWISQMSYVLIGRCLF